MKQGGICLVFEGVIFTESIITSFLKRRPLEYQVAYRECVDATLSTSDLIRDILLRIEVDSSYWDIIYQLDDATDFSNFNLEEHNIFRSPEVLPPFVQVKKEQMERARDWSHWDLNVRTVYRF